MRKSKTLAKVNAGEPIRMACLGHFIPSFIKHAAHFKFDCIWLDLEHRLIDDQAVQTILAMCHLADIDCMVRPPTLEKTELYRYLEDGATGIMIPHVSTPEKAQMLADSVKFPPLGDRGLDGAGLDADFFLCDQKAYPDAANEETFLVVQIETPEAVENVDAIAAIPGVDGLFIGTSDLNLRIDRLEGVGFTIEEAFARVAAAAAKHNKFWGSPAGTPERMQELHQQGAQIIANGGEFFAIIKLLQEISEDFDRLFGKI